MIIGEAFPDSFADNLTTALRDDGWTVTVVSPFPAALTGGGPLRARVRAELPALPGLALRMQSHVLDAVDECRPELVVNLDFRLAWPVVREIKRRRVTTAFWFPDAPGNLGREAHVIAEYDGIFVKDSAVAGYYRRMLGLNAHYLPEACNPRWHRPPHDVSPGDDGPAVLLAGNMYASRYALVRRLQREKIPVALHGPPWPRWLPQRRTMEAAQRGAYLERGAKARAFRGSLLVLNPLASHEADGLNCRLFEATACGAVVLTEWRDRLPELFAVGDEVLSFQDFDGLIEGVRTVGGWDPVQRRRLGDAARARAHRDHNYVERFHRMRTYLGL